jgi:hypothetical protein
VETGMEKTRRMRTTLVKNKLTGHSNYRDRENRKGDVMLLFLIKRNNQSLCFGI